MAPSMRWDPVLGGIKPTSRRHRQALKMALFQDHAVTKRPTAGPQHSPRSFENLHFESIHFGSIIGAAAGPPLRDAAKHHRNGIIADGWRLDHFPVRWLHSSKRPLAASSG